MRHFTRTFLAAAAGLLLTISLPARSDSCTSLEEIEWLVGYWESRSGELGSRERGHYCGGWPIICASPF
jgi:hypothetical protein